MDKCSGLRRLRAAASFSGIVALSACRAAGGSAASTELHASEVDLGAANGSALACDLAGACKPFAKGDALQTPARIKTTRGARSRLDLGSGASLDIGGEASVLIAGDANALTVEQGLVRVDAARGIDVGLLDHTAHLDGKIASSVAVMATAADRATLTVHRGKVTLSSAHGEPVPLSVGETTRVVLGEEIDRRADVAAEPALGVRAFEEEPKNQAPRGFGSLSARVPGTNEVVAGVRLKSHRVAVTVREGFARTEVEEEFANTTGRALEGTLHFPVPPGASLARLALWVGKDLVEGEIVERTRAARIFKGIVDDTVRPRDPALLEWVQGGAFALKIFPLPAHGSRKVVLAYDEALPERGGRVRYVYPLSLGGGREVAVEDFSFSLTASEPGAAPSEVMTPNYPAAVATEADHVTATYSARRFVPNGDFEIGFQRAASKPVETASYAPSAREFGDDARSFVALRLRVDLPEGTPAPARQRIDRAVVVDVSHSQSKETLAREARVATGLLRDLGPDERFVVIACDSGCSSYPDDGLRAADDASIDEARSFLEARAIGGSSDVTGAILEAAERLGASAAGQAILIGDGQATSGELSTDSIAKTLRPTLARSKIDLRFLGMGRTLDEIVLGGLARELGAAYERVDNGESLAARTEELALDLRRPLVTNAKLTLPAGFSDMQPSVLPNLRLGDEMLVVARFDGTAETKGEARLEGELAGKPYALVHATEVPRAGTFQNPIVPRLWAERRIAELEMTANDESSNVAIVELSKRFHVASRRTSLLVLENDRMFAEFGIARTTKDASDQSDHVFGMLGPAPLASNPPEAFGAIGLLNESTQGTPGSPWSAGDTDNASARGNMWGDNVGESFGRGGLGLSGIGEGGAGKGTGQGFGKVTTLGHGSSMGQVHPSASGGYASAPEGGGGRLGGSHKSTAPSVRMGATMVSGRLPPEVIQRIVRQNFGRFRLCYENALKTNPNLEGRVSVRFVIGRDGSVPVASDGGSSIADADMVKCVVATFRMLSFPEPAEGSGAVTVIYPIVFNSDGSRPSGARTATPEPPPERPNAIWPLRADELPPRPTAVHVASDESWRNGGESALAKLRTDVASDGTSRRKREALIRGLLAHGHFDEAVAAADAFSDADPDAELAGELLAEARAANGDGAGALAAVDAAVESAPTSISAHQRAARAFEAAGDERRACAHFRSLVDLRPSSESDLSQSLRCRARSSAFREAALTEAKALEKPGAQLAKMVTLLEAGKAPAFEDAAPSGQFGAKLSCEGDTQCGALVIIAPGGRVVSPWTPSSCRSSSAELGLAGVTNGVYATRLIGSPKGKNVKVTLRALGGEKTFDLEGKPEGMTVATTHITNVDPWGG